MMSSEHQIPFRLLAEETQEYAIFLLDPEGRVKSWNQGAEKIKGYAEEEILGKHFSVFYPEEDIQAGRPEKNLRIAARSGDCTDEGWRMRKDGSRFWAHVTITALYDEASADEESQLRGFAKVTRDLTDRRRREEKLKRQRKEAKEARRRADQEKALLKLMQRVTALANESESLEEVLGEATDTICEYTGWPVGHVYWHRKGENPPLLSSHIWHLPDTDQFETFRRVSEETHFDLDEGLPGRVGVGGRSSVWIEDVSEDPDFIRSRKVENLGVRGAFAFPVQSRSETLAVLEFFSTEREERDDMLMEAICSIGTQLGRVAEREEARKTIKESEEKFRSLSEESLVGIGLIQEGVYEYVNPTLAEITGYSREELIGKSPKFFVHPQDWSKAKKQIRRRIEGEADKVRYETRIQRQGGETRHVQVAGARITYQGRPAAIATIQDVTDERRMQREILKVQEEERRRFGQDLHDGVAGQLTGATLMVNTLKMKLEGGMQPEGGQTEWKKAHLAGKAEKIEQLLRKSGEDLRRVARGLNPVVLEEEGLSSALERLAENTEGCRVERTGPAEELFEEEITDDEEAHLYWIAQEAVANAQRHGKAETIAIRLEREDKTLLLEVEDDGTGFDAPKPSQEGIGLRTMKYRAELLGGELRVESCSGEGTLVGCRLPL